MISKSFSALDRIESITKGLRTFSRMDSSEAKPFSPHKAVNDSIDLIKGIYKADGIEFENNIDTGSLNLKLLIIDDESDIRDVLKMSFETLGVVVATLF